jgi:hypothetical protein
MRWNAGIPICRPDAAGERQKNKTAQATVLNGTVRGADGKARSGEWFA